MRHVYDTLKSAILDFALYYNILLVLLSISKQNIAFMDVKNCL